MPCVRSRIGWRLGCWIEHRLLPAASPGVGVDELRLDGAGPDQRDLHDDVVEPLGLRVQDRCDLRPALDLERADRLAAGDEVVRRLVVGRDAVHRRPVARAALDLVERVAHQRQGAESEEVELRHADEVEIVLVELDDRAAHRRLLDGHVVAERFRREHEPADVGRPQSRQSLEGPDRREQRAAAWPVDVELEPLGEALADGGDGIRRLGVVQPLGELRRVLRRVAERAHRVLDGVRCPVVLDGARDRRLRPLVLVVDVVEHLLAPVVLEVDVDVRRLGLAVGALLGEEALEQQAVSHRIDGRDAEQVRDDGVGGAAASLAENALRLGEVHRVPHHEKEAGEPEAVDDAELVIDLFHLRLAQRVAPALLRADEDALAEVARVGVTGPGTGNFGIGGRIQPSSKSPHSAAMRSGSSRCPARVPAIAAPSPRVKGDATRRSGGGSRPWSRSRDRRCSGAR